MTTIDTDTAFTVELTADEIGALITSTSIALDNLTRKAARESNHPRGAEAARQARLLHNALTELRDVQLEIIGSEDN